MRRQYGGAEVAIADRVTGQRGADHLDLIPGEVGNLPIIPSLLGVAEGDDAGDAIFLVLREIFDGAVVYGGALTASENLLDFQCCIYLARRCLRVAAGDNDGVRALRGSVAKDTLHLPNAGWVGTAGEEVGGEKCAVVDTLDGDLAWKCRLEVVSNVWADNSAL